MDVDDAAGQGEGEGHPCQGETVTEAATGLMRRQDLFYVNGVDQRPSKNGHACAETGTTCHAVASRRLHFPATHGAMKPPKGEWAASLPAGSCGSLLQRLATRLLQIGFEQFNLYSSLKWDNNILIYSFKECFECLSTN